MDVLHVHIITYKENMMKIRNGFVSNSSSSSFCIFGACIDGYAVYEFVKSVGVSDDLLNDYEDNICESMDAIGYEFEKKTGLEYICASYEEPTLLIGRTPESLKDDETGLQFKESVNKVFEKYSMRKARYITESFYN